MPKRGEGRIVNIASDAARVGTSDEPSTRPARRPDLLYQIAGPRTGTQECADQRRLSGPTNTPMMARSLAKASRPSKERCYGPGIPLRRMGEPKHYGGIVAMLASDDGKYITGQTISVRRNEHDLNARGNAIAGSDKVHGRHL